MNLFLRGTGLASVLITGASMRAQASGDSRPELLVGAGILNVLHDARPGQAMGSIEYRFPDYKWHLRPWVGLAQAEFGTWFASAGLLYTFKPADGWRLSAGWAPSYYDQAGGRNLGSDLEFYSFAEVGYELSGGNVISLRFGHLSNGGLADYNPGIETLQLSCSLPLGR